MVKVNVDSTTMAQLHNLNTTLEVCDTAGRTLGFFHPTPTCQVLSPFSAEELRQRRQQRSGRPLSEIIERLAP